MDTIIKKIFLDGVEIPREKAQALAEKYIQDRMGLECFQAGMNITTPEGVLMAEVELIN